MKIRLGLLLAFLLALFALGCGASDDGGGDGGSGRDASAEADGGMHHIHGLGVTSDGALQIATHDGIWIARAGQTAVARHGESRQDVMGFSALDDERFLGSGHPAPGDTEQPANLGLIESRDGGLSWSSVSLLGEVDFHVLESAGSYVYGVDSGTGALFVSTDLGRTWKQRSLPAAAVSLAIDPRAPERIVAATEAGLFASADAGRRWRPLKESIAGLLAWPRPEAMYLADAQGTVHLSRDGGRSWSESGDAGGQPAAFIADGDELYLALTDNLVERSDDGGRTWRIRATPQSTASAG